MISFLKKLGSILANAAGIFAGIGPIISPYLGSKGNEYVGKAVNDLTAVGQVVVQAEAILGAGTGPQKLAASVPLVMSILQTSELFAGKKIADTALFQKAATEITQGVVDALNAIHPDEAKHAS